MTLAQWSDANSIAITQSKHGGTSVVVGIGSRAYFDLFHLSDYAVSTVSGIVVWLVPREPS
jgi:hypothetical protein